LNGRYLASADTPDGPTLAVGSTPAQALILALEPFDGMIEELIDSLPDWVLAGR
jgi:hypothetical protein